MRMIDHCCMVKHRPRTVDPKPDDLITKLSFCHLSSVRDIRDGEEESLLF